MKGSDNVFPKLLFLEGAAAATPVTNTVVAYAKADGKLYIKDDSGTESPLGGGGGGSAAWGSITGTLSSQTDLQAALNGKVTSVVAGANITVDNTDPRNPIISAITGGGSVGDLLAGTNVTLSGVTTGRLLGAGNVTINATGGSGGGTVTSVQATGSTGLTVGGTNPITTSGTITFTLSSNLQAWSGVSPTAFETSLREIPTNVQNANYILQTTDFGRTVEKTAAGAISYTLGATAPAGTCITVLNSSSSGTITISRLSSSLYKDGVDADITVAPGNMVTMLRTSVAGRWQA